MLILVHVCHVNPFYVATVPIAFVEELLSTIAIDPLTTDAAGLAGKLGAEEQAAAS